MKSIWLLVFCLSLVAEEFPFPADSKTVSMATDSLGDRIAVWEEKGRILVSKMPLNGNWSMPSVLSSAMEEAASPQLRINSKGKVSITWVEGKNRKKVSKSLKEEWAFESQEDFSFRSEASDIEKKKRMAPIKRTIQPLANAIDAPTSSVLTGAQIGFAAGTAAPSNGLTVSGQSLFRTSSNFVGGSVEIGGSDRISFAIGGTKTSTDGSSQSGIFLNPTYAPTANTSIATNVLSFPQFNPPMGVTITTAANIYLQTGGQGGAGAVTNGYNLYVENAGFGTNSYAAYFNGRVGIFTLTPQNSLDVSGGVAIGSYAGVNTAPANGLICSGIAGFDTSAPISDGALPIQINAAAAGERYLGANKAGTYGFLVGYINGTGLGTGGIFRMVTTDPLYFYVNNVVLAAQLTSAGFFGLNATPVNRLDVGGGVAIGTFAGVNTAPSNGLLVSGQVGIGTTAPGNGFVSISPSTANLYGLVVGGAVRGISGTDDALGVVAAATLTGPTSGTISAIELLVSPLFAAGAGTVDTMYGAVITSGTTTSDPTTGYGLYVEQPAYGATAYAASIQGGMVHIWNGQNADYTITTADYYVALTGTGTPRTFTLPGTMPVAGWTVVVKDEGGGAAVNNLTVSGNGNPIDGAATYVINTGLGVVRIYSNGTDYFTW